MQAVVWRAVHGILPGACCVCCWCNSERGSCSVRDITQTFWAAKSWPSMCTFLPILSTVCTLWIPKYHNTFSLMWHYNVHGPIICRPKLLWWRHLAHCTLHELCTNIFLWFTSSITRAVFGVKILQNLNSPILKSFRNTPGAKTYHQTNIFQCWKDCKVQTSVKWVGLDRPTWVTWRALMSVLCYNSHYGLNKYSVQNITYCSSIMLSNFQIFV